MGCINVQRNDREIDHWALRAFVKFRLFSFMLTTGESLKCLEQRRDAIGLKPDD